MAVTFAATIAAAAAAAGAPHAAVRLLLLTQYLAPEQ